jgi:hypothetical protein
MGCWVGHIVDYMEEGTDMGVEFGPHGSARWYSPIQPRLILTAFCITDFV